MIVSETADEGFSVESEEFEDTVNGPVSRSNTVVVDSGFGRVHFSANYDSISVDEVDEFIELLCKVTAQARSNLDY